MICLKKVFFGGIIRFYAHFVFFHPAFFNAMFQIMKWSFCNPDCCIFSEKEKQVEINIFVHQQMSQMLSIEFSLYWMRNIHLTTIITSF